MKNKLDHLPDEIFSTRTDEWRVRMNGRVLRTTWSTRNAAQIGMAFAQHRETYPPPRSCWLNFWRTGKRND